MGLDDTGRLIVGALGAGLAVTASPVRVLVGSALVVIAALWQR